MSLVPRSSFSLARVVCLACSCPSALLLAVAIQGSVLSHSVQSADWRQFRGTDNNSAVVGDGLPPTQWDSTSGVAWQIDLPGRGPSSPIVIGNQVFVTCSGGSKQDRLYVLGLDAKTGQQQWRREFWATGRTLSHPTSANAAPTPASDGKHIFAFFSSNDLICLDLNGNLKWYRGLASDYPKAGNDVGMSSSPVVAMDTVIVQVENQGDSFAAGIDAETGENRWRIKRPSDANWSSPVILQQEHQQPVVLLQSPFGITAHDILTGKELWRYETSCDAITSATALGTMVLLPSKGVSAISVPGPGESPKLLWNENDLAPSAASPVVAKDKVYTVNRSGVLIQANLSDGKVVSKTRLGIGQQWATPAIVAGHAYCLDSNGKAAVVKLADEKAEVVWTGELGESIQASPAIADGALYIRSDKHLWKIAN